MSSGFKNYVAHMLFGYKSSIYLSLCILQDLALNNHQELTLNQILLSKLLLFLLVVRPL